MSDFTGCPPSPPNIFLDFLAHRWPSKAESMHCLKVAFHISCQVVMNSTSDGLLSMLMLLYADCTQPPLALTLKPVK